MGRLSPGGAYCASGAALVSLKPAIDDAASSMPNGIIESDETVNLIGSLQNSGALTASAVTGIVTTPDPIIINNPNAVYPDILPAAIQTCTSCYSITAPLANRTATHWDVTVRESPACSACSTSWYEFLYHIGSSFTDVPISNIFYSYIETLLHSGVTAGCTGTTFCPSSTVTRDQMAKFICASMNKKKPGSCTPATCTGIFTDVTAANIFCPYIEALYTAGVVNGCLASPLSYCPANTVQRQQMAKFMCNAMNTIIPGSCPIASCTAMFDDVQPSNVFCSYIEGLYNAGVISGCQSSPMLYCPANLLSRSQMAKFLVTAFGFTL